MAQSPSPSTQDQPEPPRLKFLRWLVIGLTVTMILGLITIVVLMIMTFMRTGDRPTTVDAPAQITLPGGEAAQAFTKGNGWNAVVTRDADGQDRIHILDPESGEIRQTILIK